MYYTCDRNGFVLSYSDVLEFEPNTNSEEFVYVNDYICIWKTDRKFFPGLEPKDQDNIKITPEPYIMTDDQIKEAILSKARADVIKKAGELIAEKKKEVSENRDIGFLTEKFRIAKSVLRKTAEQDDADDFETEIQLRGKGETKDELAKKVKQKYKKMYRRMVKLDAYYNKFLLRIEKRNKIENIDNAFERFKEELEDRVRR